MTTLLGSSALRHLTTAQANYSTGRSFFPHLMSVPFGKGLSKAFDLAAVVCVIGAGASLLRGGKYHYQEAPTPALATQPAREAVAETEPLLVD